MQNVHHQFKHDFTCPDTIFLLQRQKRNFRRTIIGLTAFYAFFGIGGWLWSRHEDKKLEAELNNFDNAQPHAEARRRQA